MEKTFYYPTEDGNIIIIYEEDIPLTSCFRWRVIDGYASSSVFLGNNHKPRQRTVRLHRLLMGFPKYVDHINGVRLDNRRINLRSVTNRQNKTNYPSHRKGHLPWTHQLPSGNFRARVVVNKKTCEFWVHLNVLFWPIL